MDLLTPPLGMLRSKVVELELRLLEEKHGEPPILLLDDFSAELDADRRGYLLALTERGPQALVSGTDAPPHAARVLRIAAGEVSGG